MITEKKIKVTNHGMISIPAYFREKYNINDGDHLTILEDEDGLRIIPILSIEVLRKSAISSKQMGLIMQKSRQEELELDK